MVWITRTQRLLDSARPRGKEFVRTLFSFRFATSLFVNFVLRSCITFDGFTSRLAVHGRNTSVRLLPSGHFALEPFLSPGNYIDRAVASKYTEFNGNSPVTERENDTGYRSSPGSPVF